MQDVGRTRKSKFRAGAKLGVAKKSGRNGINYGLVFQHHRKPDSSAHCFAVSFLEPGMTRKPKFRTSRKAFPF